MEKGDDSLASFSQTFGFYTQIHVWGNRLEWIDWKKEETDRVAGLYKDEEAFLSTNPNASYFKGIINIKKGRGRAPYETKDSFGKSTQGTYSKPYQILKKNTNKNPYTGKVQDAHSFLL